MRLRQLFLSRWVKIPVLLVALAIFAALTFVAYRLAITTPSMYNTAGVIQAKSDSAFGDQSETLVYTSLRPGNWDIYLFDDLSKAPRRLTDNPNLDYNPVLSRDGRWVVFVSERDGNANLYALDLLSETAPLALTSYPGLDDSPTL